MTHMNVFYKLQVTRIQYVKHLNNKLAMLSEIY